MIESEGIETYGKTAVVIGRSHNVGLPIAIILGADKQKGIHYLLSYSANYRLTCHRVKT